MADGAAEPGSGMRSGEPAAGAGAVAGSPGALPARAEPHAAGLQARLNWLRAGVLGANDGIISTAGLVIGVAAATDDSKAILVAGVASLASGAVSMALGEYVSVSSQRDTERALIALERQELADDPEGELAELTGLYEARGLAPETARQVALELTAHDAVGAHVEAELGLDPLERTNPWQAAFASAVSFTVGALLPLLAVVLAPPGTRVAVTAAAVVVALALTGTISARLGRARRLRAVVRLIVGGVLAMAITFAIGNALGQTVLA
ncbi:VIT family protein [Actinotalea sp. JY-7885]|uniref:VIT1/CCC1 transporter family protein n=1 Tax=Actinotalea sp. JY-7885 TaxID=2758576 RepID=UPI002105A480|nr:VIT family protein [Actinotalea sp. JY-7885]